jgi:excisionase family DNA binding protein
MYNTIDLSEMLGVSRETVRMWAQCLDMPHERRGFGYCFVPEQVAAWLRESPRRAHLADRLERLAAEDRAAENND